MFDEAKAVILNSLPWDGNIHKLGRYWDFYFQFGIICFSIRVLFGWVTSFELFKIDFQMLLHFWLFTGNLGFSKMEEDQLSNHVFLIMESRKLEMEMTEEFIIVSYTK